MAKHGSTMKDEHYDLISVLYHAIQGEETLARYIEDAEKAGDSELVDHYQEVQETYREIARDTKELLKEKLVGEEAEEDEEE